MCNMIYVYTYYAQKQILKVSSYMYNVICIIQ